MQADHWVLSTAWRNRVGRRSASLAATVLMAVALIGCAATRTSVPREVSHAIPSDPASPLARQFAAQALGHPGQSGFKVLASGRAGFVARAELARAAAHSLDLQYYSAADDLSSAVLLQHIDAAAQRGVRVRIVLDDIHPPSRTFALRAVALHPNIGVRIFNPFFIGGTNTLGRLAEFAFDAARLNRRMHNKLWIADNVAAIVGSRNLGDAYFGANPSANFTDAEVLAAGPIVSSMSDSFDAYWNSASAVPIQAVESAVALDGPSVREWLHERTRACGDGPPCAWLVDDVDVVPATSAGDDALTWAAARFHWDDPDVDKTPPATGIAHGAPTDDPDGIRTARELLIVSPYFIPSPHGSKHLAEMTDRGVRVAILTNSLASTDVPAAHAGYARHRVPLLRDGVELYELRPEPGVPHKRTHRWGQASPVSLHAKLIVQDRVRAIVGSYNQDPRSRQHNTEAWIVVHSAALASELAALFDEGSAPEHAYRVELLGGRDGSELSWHTEEDNGPVRYADEPLASGWMRLWRRALGTLIPEHLL